MRSVRLRKLDKRYWSLRLRYLPRHFSKTGTYTYEQYTDCIAFRVLFHAELETFLEEVALEKLSEISNLITSGKNCLGSAAIVTLFKTESMHGFPSQKQEFKDKPFLLRTQQACIYELKRRIENNRGVKAANLLAMFLPLGIDELLLDDQFLIDLTTFGSQRGEVAHRGLGAVTTLPDPREDKVLVERIIVGLALFEQTLVTITA